MHVVSKDNFTMLMAASVGGLLSVVKQVIPHSMVDATVVSTHTSEGGYSALMYSSMPIHACLEESCPPIPHYLVLVRAHLEQCPGDLLKTV